MGISKGVFVLIGIVIMILPFQAASAVATGLYGISLEESLFNLINENNGKIIGDPTSLGFIVLPNDPVPTTDYGGTAMSIHSDGRFFASLFDSAIGDQTEPTLSVIDSNLVVTPSADCRIRGFCSLLGLLLAVASFFWTRELVLYSCSCAVLACLRRLRRRRHRRE